MPEVYVGVQGRNHRRRRTTAVNSAGLIRIQSSGRDRIDCRRAGGIVSLGANASTLEQTIGAMHAAEALRSDLISKIDPRLVGERKL